MVRLVLHKCPIYIVAKQWKLSSLETVLTYFFKGKKSTEWNERKTLYIYKQTLQNMASYNKKTPFSNLKSINLEARGSF